MRPTVVFLRIVAAPLTLGLAAICAAQQAPPALPEVVTKWLERDQEQRWANLLRVGEKRFAEGSCSKCHGAEGKGGPLGPDLTDATWSHSQGDLGGIRDTIFWGVRRRDFADPDRRFEMNPGGGMDLEWEEVDAVAAYVWSLSNGTFLP
jgi:mono/diheme cytochrome c family protein